MRFRINLERRRGNVDAVHELYSACIAKGKNKATKTALSIKYSIYFFHLVPLLDIVS